MFKIFLRPSATSRRYSYIRHHGNEGLHRPQASSIEMASDTGSENVLHTVNQAFDYDADDEPPIETRGSPIQVRQHENHSTLPTVDGGSEAWLFLAGSFLIEALVWGKFFFSPSFSHSQSNAAWYQMVSALASFPRALILRFIGISPL